MKKRIFLKLLLTSCILIGCDFKKDENLGMDISSQSYVVDDSLSHVEGKDCKVILIYGQSNATGYSHNIYLDESDEDLYVTYLLGFNNVKINYVIEGNPYLTDNKFVKLKLSNTNVGATFGPEMGIGEEYNKYFPDEDIFIIKYAYGGSSIANDWLTKKGKRNIMYNNAINFTKTSLNYLKDIGYKINIEGICWMQGEADAFDPIYNDYYNNTSKLVGYFRKDLNKYQSTIRFIDAYIEDIDVWPRYKEINEQKLQFASSDENNFVIDTIKLGLRTDEEPWEGPDIYHYDSMSMVMLGRAFADTMINN